jgi:hypothetical protein
MGRGRRPPPVRRQRLGLLAISTYGRPMRTAVPMAGRTARRCRARSASRRGRQLLGLQHSRCWSMPQRQARHDVHQHQHRRRATAPAWRRASRRGPMRDRSVATRMCSGFSMGVLLGNAFRLIQRFRAIPSKPVQASRSEWLRGGQARNHRQSEAGGNRRYRGCAVWPIFRAGLTPGMPGGLYRHAVPGDRHHRDVPLAHAAWRPRSAKIATIPNRQGTAISWQSVLPQHREWRRPLPAHHWAAYGIPWSLSGPVPGTNRFDPLPQLLSSGGACGTVHYFKAP